MIVTWIVARMEGMQILVGKTVGKGPYGRRGCEWIVKKWILGVSTGFFRCMLRA